MGRLACLGLRTPLPNGLGPPPPRRVVWGAHLPWSRPRDLLARPDQLQEEPVLVVCGEDLVSDKLPSRRCGPYRGGGRDEYRMLSRHRYRVWLVEPQAGEVVAETKLDDRDECPGSIQVAPGQRFSLGGWTESSPDWDAAARWVRVVLARMGRRQ